MYNTGKMTMHVPYAKFSADLTALKEQARKMDHVERTLKSAAERMPFFSGISRVVSPDLRSQFVVATFNISADKRLSFLFSRGKVPVENSRYLSEKTRLVALVVKGDVAKEEANVYVQVLRKCIEDQIQKPAPAVS